MLNTTSYDVNWGRTLIAPNNHIQISPIRSDQLIKCQSGELFVGDEQIIAETMKLDSSADLLDFILTSDNLVSSHVYMAMRDNNLFPRNWFMNSWNIFAGDVQKKNRKHKDGPYSVNCLKTGFNYSRVVNDSYQPVAIVHACAVLPKGGGIRFMRYK